MFGLRSELYRSVSRLKSIYPYNMALADVYDKFFNLTAFNNYISDAHGTIISASHFFCSSYLPPHGLKYA